MAKQIKYKWRVSKNKALLTLWDHGDKNPYHFCPHDLEISTFKPIPVIQKEKRQLAVKEGLKDLLDKETDTQLYIRGYSGLDAFPVTGVYFGNGEFLLAERITELGPGYVGTNGKHLKTVKEFKKDITNYFKTSHGALNYKEFKSFITQSNLPRQVKNAVRGIIA